MHKLSADNVHLIKLLTDVLQFLLLFLPEHQRKLFSGKNYDLAFFLDRQLSEQAGIESV